jgi:hypothetical protein
MESSTKCSAQPRRCRPKGIEEPDEDEEDRPTKKFTPVQFREACIKRLQSHFGESLIKQTAAAYASPDGKTAVVCAISREYQDRLQLLIDQLSERSRLPDNARLDEVQNAAAILTDPEAAILMDYVPYRFLTPWFRSALIDVKDHARHGLIQLLAERSALSPRPAPYRFHSVIGRPLPIIIGAKWLTFLQSNHLPLKAFAQYFGAIVHRASPCYVLPGAGAHGG